MDSLLPSARLVNRMNYYSVQLFEAPAEEIPEDFISQASTIINVPKDTVISCAGISTVPKIWIQVFQFLTQQLKEANKKLFIVYVNAKILSILRKPDKGHPIQVETDLATALSELEASQFDLIPKGPQKTHYIKAFVSATTRTLLVQARIFCTQEKIFVLPADTSEKLLGDISGIIVVESTEVTYLLILSFPLDSFLSVMSKMLGEIYKEIQNDLLDGAAELINIIFGVAKTVLNRQNVGIKSQLPTLVVGKTLDDNLSSPSHIKIKELLKDGKIVVVPFETNVGPFYVQICFPDGFNWSQYS